MNAKLMILLSAFATALSADVKLPSVLGDHMVLQRSAATAIWGKAAPAETVTVEIGGATATATADADGEWITHLDLTKVPQNGPFTLTVKGKNKLEVQDVLLGDVWLAGGQSNMAKVIGPQPNQFPCIDWKKEVRQSVGRNQIRMYRVGWGSSTAPLKENNRGRWVLPSLATTPKFTAVGYFFAETLNKVLKKPIGIVDSSVGGTSVFQWTSRETLLANADTAASLKKQDADLKAEQQFVSWCKTNGALYQPGKLQRPKTFLASDGWQTIELKGTIRPPRGVNWYRATFTLPPEQQRQNFALKGLKVRNMYRKVLCNGRDIEYVDGRHYTAITEQDVKRGFMPGKTADGTYTIALRLTNPTNDGAIFAPEGVVLTSGKHVIPLKWETKNECTFPPLAPEKAAYPKFEQPTNWTFLYNGLIAPFTNLTLSGVIWYQGEQDWKIPDQYQQHFSNLIADWRKQFKRPDLPFYFCQLPGFGKVSADPNTNPAWARLRNSQFLVSRTVPNTGMAVTIDLGETSDIHPRRKREVGERLAQIALTKNYGKTTDCTGPVYRTFKVEGNKIRILFDHTEGLRAAEVAKTYEIRGDKAPGTYKRQLPGSPLEGFAIRGSDSRWHWAHAETDGSSVIVSSPKVKTPVAVRYNWGNTVFGNLTNRTGLPASPFTTETR